MRRALSLTLWVYLGWYATSLASEFVAIPGFLGAGIAMAAVVLVQRRRMRISVRPAGQTIARASRV